MAEFGKWTKIEPGCEMPEHGDEVLVLIQEKTCGVPMRIYYEVDLGTYEPSCPYIWTPYNELGGFDTNSDWISDLCDIKVIAWMPKPPAKLEG